MCKRLGNTAKEICKYDFFVISTSEKTAANFQEQGFQFLLIALFCSYFEGNNTPSGIVICLPAPSSGICVSLIVSTYSLGNLRNVGENRFFDGALYSPWYSKYTTVGPGRETNYLNIVPGSVALGALAGNVEFTNTPRESLLVAQDCCLVHQTPSGSP